MAQDTDASLTGSNRLPKRSRRIAETSSQKAPTSKRIKALKNESEAPTTADPTHSNVDSSIQPDKTGSCEVPPPTVSTNPHRQQQIEQHTVKAELSKVGGAVDEDQGRQHEVVEAEKQIATAEANASKAHKRKEEASPVAKPSPAAGAVPSKKRRLSRAEIPGPLGPQDLKVTDRFSGPHHPDDQDGHFFFHTGENFTPRFKIMRKVGEGTFGRVVECWDRVRRDYVAVKVIRNVQKYRDAAMIELEVLSTLAANDPEGCNHCVRLLEWFDYRGHVCMVFERLGPSLYDCLKRNVYKPFPLVMVREFMRQLFQAVAYMHELTMVHTDLKPENILLLSQELVRKSPEPGSIIGKRLPDSAQIKVIDFGSATFDSDRHSSIVSTRHYRAPEIILGLGWNRACDLWSLGCIIVELLTGEALYQTHENVEHLKMMDTTLGSLPTHMLRKCVNEVKDLFDKNGQVKWAEWAGNDRKKLRAVHRLTRIQSHLEAHSDKEVKPHVKVISDLICKLMAYEPSRRLTAAEALQHAFFSIDLPTST
jgi:dual-specificity kinase